MNSDTEVRGNAELNRLAIQAALGALKAIHTAAAAHLDPAKLAELDRHVLAGHTVTAVCNMTGAQVDASLAMCGPGPLDTRILFKLECVLGGVLDPAWSCPGSASGKPN